MNSASPSLSEIEFTIALPWMHFKPFSITFQRELSTMMGTRAMSGSDATKFKKRTIAASASSMPSSMLMSMICAPFSTWVLATSKASSYRPFKIKRANAFEPVTLVRSPTLTNKLSISVLKGSKPDKRIAGFNSGKARGVTPSTASHMARMWSGVVPQQPPTMLTKPDSAHSLMFTAMSSGVKS